ncbi:hypothetical protein SEA_STICKYNOTE_5 [Corynebacterium phage Stickynote]|uniref:Uncharacterized protein n=4 Tax=Ceetrepovirus TaxID=2560111 RepID=A0A2H4P8L7_9CAUD|nr:hypothetical protein FDJ10_gp05 [Corynebacterium phage C3PO]YP_009620256.1 hypothetical protein FDJ11_gp05 [Corynebacterium phage Darwin]YP_010103205.1 hypothetical protein KNU65_gp05 [Corynebacterium phage Stickynote]AYQ98305.1 hypothetical protein CRUELLA_5 [Corynebacterium phage Cruella]ATW58508.1 hypothetical protein SEA_C3PO_5 [Corynebacterium phage C3PO]ATW58566.1 hypothetical protein SEA_DARWIN_5 [Corynebacterium phage Darwin]QDF19202.1 hypothetical protein SEA_STICKYNOTE_5 [Coryneb
MNKSISFGAAIVGILLSLLLYAAYGALFAWGLQQPLENILDREIRYKDLFLVAFLLLVFLNPKPVKVE